MLDAFALVVRAVNRACTFLAGALAAGIMLVVIWSILARYWNVSANWASDFAQFGFAWLVALALAPALASGDHVTVELFDPLLPKSWQRWLPRAAALACIVFGAVLTWQLWKITSRSFDGRLALSVVPMPLLWVQILAPLGAAQFTLTALVLLLRGRLDP